METSRPNQPEDSTSVVEAPEADNYTGSEHIRLLDRALDDIGSGPFQHKLMAVIASALFLDATTEPLILSLLFPAIQTEWGGDDDDLAMIVSFNELGKMFGALTFGMISDQFGRKASYTVSLIICTLFGFLSSYANSYYGFAVLRLFVGYGYGGNMIACMTLLVEYLPTMKRGLYVSISSIVYCLGSVFVVLMCWGTLPFIGFRWILRLASLLGVPIIIALCFVPESIRFLLSKRRYEKAVEYIEKVARENKQEIPDYFTLSTFRKIDPRTFIEKESDLDESVKVKKCSNCSGCCVSGLSDVKLLCKSNILLTLIPLSLIWFCNNFAYAVFIWAPLEIDRKFSNISSDEHSVEFEVGLVLASGLVTGTLVALACSLYFKRRWVLGIGTGGCSFFVILLGAIGTRPVMYLNLILLAIFSSITLNGLYVYSPEVFPTSVRVTAFGVCQFAHRSAPVLAPFAIAAVDKISFNGVCYMMGVIYFIGFCMCFALRIESFNAPLVEENDKDEYPEQRGRMSFQTLYDVNEDLEEPENEDILIPNEDKLILN